MQEAKRPKPAADPAKRRKPILTQPERYVVLQIQRNGTDRPIEQTRHERQTPSQYQQHRWLQRYRANRDSHQVDSTQDTRSARARHALAGAQKLIIHLPTKRSGGLGANQLLGWQLETLGVPLFKRSDS